MAVLRARVHLQGHHLRPTVKLSDVGHLPSHQSPIPQLKGRFKDGRADGLMCAKLMGVVPFTSLVMYMFGTIEVYVYLWLPDPMYSPNVS